MNKNCLEHCPRIQARSDAIDDAVAAAVSSDPAHPEKYTQHAAAIIQAGQAYLATVMYSYGCPNPTEISTNKQTGSPSKAACALIEYLCSAQVVHSERTIEQT